MLSYLEKHATKIYLVIANFLLVVFAIWFSNVGLLPFEKNSDFIFFTILTLALAIYRPSWTFAFFVGTLVLENINLAPQSLGISVRPFQLLGAVTLLSLLVQYFSNRLNFSLPKWKWQDTMPIIFIIGGVLGSFAAPEFGPSFKQAIVAASFAALYYLTRVYIQNFEDAKRVTLFVISSGVIVSIYAIWQNVIFLQGGNSFEVMPGRPNATFTEPDWLGVYLVFLLAVILTTIYFESKKTKISNFKFQISNQFQISYAILGLAMMALILTVSRSAWLGAVLITIGFLKMILTNGSVRISNWKWKNFAWHISFIVVTATISLLISVQLTDFQIFNRAKSTGGLQKITIACLSELNSESELSSDSVISNIFELERYGCRHINLEDIEKEKAQGLNVFEIKRPDPTVGIRAQIYAKSLEQIKANPAFGIGWGSITQVLGKDENGAGLNASNVFLEVWLGAGLLGLLSFVMMLGYILIKSSFLYLNKKILDKTAVTLVVLGLFAIVVPNLFNSGIFLGFVWVYLAVAVSLLAEKSESNDLNQHSNVTNKKTS